MVEISEYQQGMPCWVDLWTPDRPAALDFYGAVFGWEYRVAPAEQHSYTEALVRGRTVAGLVTPPGNDQAPTTWLTYLATDDIDATLAAAVAHGGKSLTGVITVPGDDEIRIAVLLDPVGAQFGAWQAAGRRGAQLVNEPGTRVWHELMTGDTATARAFYAAVFDLGISDPIPGATDYRTIRVADENVGGIGRADDGASSRWDTYFGVADPDRTVDVVRANGGTVLSGPVDTPFGRLVTCVDPQGATFSALGVPSGG